MDIPWLETHTPLPKPESAQKDGSSLAGLVAAGGGLTVERLCEAYQQGIFPWYNERQPVLWWSPNPRMVLLTKDFKLHRSLRKTLNQFIQNPECSIRIDTAFEEVIGHCAQTTRQGQTGTWIVEDMIAAYIALHRAGFAHSVETWMNGKLVGGLYCVSIGNTLFGESMFAHRTDASKIALAAFVAFARAEGLTWIDCQQNTKHLASLGAQEMPKSIFLEMVRDASKYSERRWVFKNTYWAQLMTQKVQL